MARGLFGEGNNDSKYSIRNSTAKKHWSLSEASRRVGISVNTFNRWERGLQKPQMATLSQLCKAFEMSAEELGFEEIVTPRRGSDTDFQDFEGKKALK